MLAGSHSACAVLFDLDGTLLDSAPDLAAAANLMRSRRGLAVLSAERYRQWVGSGARGMIHVAFGVTPEHAGFDALKDEFFVAYEATLQQSTRPFEGVPQLLAHLNAMNLPWGIVTNKAARFAMPLIKGFAEFDAVLAVVCGDTTPHTKPHPAPLIEAARQLGMACEACIYVGDDVRDIIAGRAAGMRTVSAAYGYLGADTDVDSWGAHGQINAPLELLQMLRKA